MNIKLVHASISENGDSGWNGKSKAGDQTGKEVCMRSWYSKPWNVLIRYPNNNIAVKASSAAVQLANSSLVGYDQSQRNTLYQELRKNGFDVDKYIASGVNTECDCSSFIYAVYSCFIPEMRSNNNAPRTATMKTDFKKWGFELYYSESLLNGKGVLIGDIMVREGSHTAMVTDGKIITPEPVKMIDIPDYGIDVSNAINIIAEDVIKGNWGNGNDRKEKLYVAIQTRVNELWRIGVH